MSTIDIAQILIRFQQQQTHGQQLGMMNDQRHAQPTRSPIEAKTNAKEEHKKATKNQVMPKVVKAKKAESSQEVDDGVNDSKSS